MRALRLPLLLVGCASSAHEAPASHPADPAPRGVPVNSASGVEQVVIRAAVPEAEQHYVLAEMISGDRHGWLLFEPSGDDLYATFAEFGDNVGQDRCAMNIRFLTTDDRAFAKLRPPVTLNGAACATSARDVVKVEAGQPPDVSWLHIERGSDEGSGWFALWKGYALETELWTWQLARVPRGSGPSEFNGHWDELDVGAHVPPKLAWPPAVDPSVTPDEP
ncbi:MAG: hypothetical protein KC492_08580 [Myxococcales bacterium]|nr:hypothetical protein [Myxococcales bacterium]